MSSVDAVLSVAPAIEALARLKAEHPLAFATLWHNDPPRTSQRAPLQRAGVDAVAAFGGNGSGKTELGAMVACAVAYGRGHAACETFIRRNKLEPSLFPPRPGIVLASSLNSTMSINIQRAAVERWAPAGTEWRNRDGPGFSEAKFPNGGKIRFLTAAAGRAAMQGFRCRPLLGRRRASQGRGDRGLSAVDPVAMGGPIRLGASYDDPAFRLLIHA